MVAEKAIAEPILEFLEEFAIRFEGFGMPRMAGRVMGWLLVCDPPAQSASDLARVVGASKGSISTSIKFLIQAGLIDKFSKPGSRSTYYEIHDYAFSEVMKAELINTTIFRKLAERGLGLVKEKPKTVRRRLEEMHRLYTFFESEWPALLERYEKERAK